VSTSGGDDGQLVDLAGNPLRLLMIHAHPDDETTTTGATARRYAEEGIPVHLVTCTRGERGEIVDSSVGDRVEDRDPEITAEHLGAYRMQELAAACHELRFAGHRYLAGPGRWWDSGTTARTTQHRCPSFSTGDLAVQSHQLAEVVRRLRPQVVITYDERGGYGHPDHIRAHDATVAAIALAADPTAESDAATPWSTSKLYACVVPHSVLQQAATTLADTRVEGPNPFASATGLGDAALPDLPFGVPDTAVTARIDARRWLPAKVAAMRAHRSQMHQRGWFFVLAERGEGLGIEHYQLLAGKPSRSPAGVEEDLFAGLRA